MISAREIRAESERFADLVTLRASVSSPWTLQEVTLSAYVASALVAASFAVAEERKEGKEVRLNKWWCVWENDWLG